MLRHLIVLAAAVGCSSPTVEGPPRVPPAPIKQSGSTHDLVGKRSSDWEIEPPSGFRIHGVSAVRGPGPEMNVAGLHVALASKEGTQLIMISQREGEVDVAVAVAEVGGTIAFSDVTTNCNVTPAIAIMDSKLRCTKVAARALRAWKVEGRDLTPLAVPPSCTVEEWACPNNNRSDESPNGEEGGI